MKKVCVLITLLSIVMSVFSTPYEAEHGDKYISQRLHDSIYVGSRYYKPIVGGIYKKNKVSGMVFYVDEDSRKMLILCITQNEIINPDDGSNYVFIERKYESNGWNLLTREICLLLVANTPTAIYNRTWEDNKQHWFVRDGYIALKRQNGKSDVEVYNPRSPRYPFSFFPDYMTFIDENGVKTLEYTAFNHTGWKEVSLEPEYVTHYIGE